MTSSSQGSRVHPAAVELRQQGIALARLMTALRIPAGESRPGAHPEPARACVACTASLGVRGEAPSHAGAGVAAVACRVPGAGLAGDGVPPGVRLLGCPSRVGRVASRGGDAPDRWPGHAVSPGGL